MSLCATCTGQRPSRRPIIVLRPKKYSSGDLITYSRQVPGPMRTAVDLRMAIYDLKVVSRALKWVVGGRSRHFVNQVPRLPRRFWRALALGIKRASYQDTHTAPGSKGSGRDGRPWARPSRDTSRTRARPPGSGARTCHGPRQKAARPVFLAWVRGNTCKQQSTPQKKARGASLANPNNINAE